MVIFVVIALIIIIGCNFNKIKHWYKLCKIKQSKEFLDSVENAKKLKLSLNEIFEFVAFNTTNPHASNCLENEKIFLRQRDSASIYVYAYIEKIYFPCHLFDLYRAEYNDVQKEKLETEILEYIFKRPISKIDLGIDSSKFVRCISFDSDWSPRFIYSFEAHKELTGEDKDIFLKMIGEKTIKDIRRSR